MRNEIMFAGFGGQGIVKAALLITQAAGLFENREVAQTQSYGPEARGGACRSEVVISDEKIAYIKTANIDCFTVMSQPSMDKYIDLIDPDHTMVIADATLIQQRPDGVKRYFPIRATEIAENDLGRTLFANIVMLGALSAVTKIVGIKALEKSLSGNVPEKTLAKNRLALQKGYEAGLGLVSE